jgi:hypothetical protein
MISDFDAYHIRTTSSGSIDGITQLAFNTTVLRDGKIHSYGAWIQTAGISDQGSPVQFFNLESPPDENLGYSIVTASFSTYLCQMSLITWMEHDLSYPLDCDGQLWLGGGLLDTSGCQAVKLLVEEVPIQTRR